MAGAFEIAFAAGLALVGVSFGAVVLDRASEKFLIAATVLLTLGSLAGWVALGINFSEDFVETPPLLLAAGGLLAAAVAEAGLLLFVRALRRLRDLDRTSEVGQQRLRAFLEEEAEAAGSESRISCSPANARPRASSSVSRNASSPRSAATWSYARLSRRASS